MASGWATDLLELSARTECKKGRNSALFEDTTFWEYQVWAVFAFCAKSSLTSLISLDFLVLFYQEKRIKETNDPSASEILIILIIIKPLSRSPSGVLAID